jgi:hypothetical protein
MRIVQTWMSLDEILAETKTLGATEEDLLRIATDLDSIFHSRMPFEDLLWEALETIRRGLKHHPSVQRVIDLRLRSGMPEELATTIG